MAHNHIHSQELITRDVPYKHITNDTIGNYQIISSLAKCTPPPEPDDLEERPYIDKELWLLCRECWNREASMRPSIMKIQEKLEVLEKV